jgi:hypothetical protein
LFSSVDFVRVKFQAEQKWDDNGRGKLGSSWGGKMIDSPTLPHKELESFGAGAGMIKSRAMSAAHIMRDFLCECL